MRRAHRPAVCLAVAMMLAGCGGEPSPPAAPSSAMPAREPAAASAPASPTEADLVAAIRKTAGVDLGDTRYFDASVDLDGDGTAYPSNPTVPPAKPVNDLAGTEILIPGFGSYSEGKSIGGPAGPRAAVYGDPSLPVAGSVLGTAIHTRDADELRYYVLKALTDRYADNKGITVTQAEKDAYVAHVREALSEDPAVPEELGEESEQDKAARQEIAAAFIMQWKINRALWKHYGGRIIYQQGGPEPLDAYRNFLEERQAARDFEIADEKLAPGFWRYYRDDSIHSFYEPGSSDEAQAFDTAPWTTWRSRPTFGAATVEVLSCLVQQLQDALVAGMDAQRVEVRVELDPGLGLVVGVRQQALEKVERRVDVAELRVHAGHVVLRQDVVRVDGHRP